MKALGAVKPGQIVCLHPDISSPADSSAVERFP
jgi:hypothetical protein